MCKDIYCMESLTPLLHSPNQQAATDDDTSNEKINEAEAHDILCVKVCYSQGRERPEWLY